MREAERQRRDIEEAQLRAEEARRLAEEAVHLQQAEREQRVAYSLKLRASLNRI